MAVELTC